ncbi:MAG: hypothetical protein JKY02_05945 [Flavobacteriaceae bacterium]|nr:hypothetical protein [Flavobacteriaceae bacterium]
MRKFILSSILITQFILGCSYTSESDLIDTTPLPTVVTYNTHIKSIIDNNCIQCHTNPPINAANTSLLTYTDVISGVENNNLISKISGNGPGGLMPLGGPSLPQNLIDLIIQWQDEGFMEE